MAGNSIRKGRPTAEASRTKLAQILDVARDLFAERGYRAVTMREVAEQANVSTRTLYNRYADKFSLFNACLSFGASAFPAPPESAVDDLEQALTDFGIEIVKILATDSSIRLSMLIYWESNEFPELLRASEDNHRKHLLNPVTRFLKTSGFPEETAEEFAKLYLALALSEWQRRMTYNQPLPTQKEIELHAARAAAMFVNGASAALAESRSDKKGKVEILAAHRPNRAKS
jgi:TetR/AcrR family transcriptional repressor of mexJK operon